MTDLKNNFKAVNCTVCDGRGYHHEGSTEVLCAACGADSLLLEEISAGKLLPGMSLAELLRDENEAYYRFNRACKRAIAILEESEKRKKSITKGNSNAND